MSDAQTYFWMGDPRLPAGHVVAPPSIRFYERFADEPVVLQNGDSVKTLVVKPAALLETIFEMVRCCEYSHQPSRFGCLFLWEHRLWAEEYHRGVPYADLYEVEVVEHSKTCRGDFRLITNFDPPDTINKMRERARQYWSGEVSGKYETLLDGKFKVVRNLSR